MNLKIEIELQALITEREGMKAENRYDEIYGNDPTHIQASFQIIVDKIRALADQIPQMSCEPGPIRIFVPDEPPAKTLQCSICNKVVVSGRDSGDICGASIGKAEDENYCPGILRKG